MLGDNKQANKWAREDMITSGNRFIDQIETIVLGTRRAHAPLRLLLHWQKYAFPTNRITYSSTLQR